MTTQGKWIVGIVVLLVLAAIAVYGFKNSSPKTVGGEPIRIGAIYGLTGAASNWAEFGKRGVDLAVAEINSAGGLNGRLLEVIYEDSQTSPATSVSSYRKLVDIDGVDVIVGDVWSFMTNPLIPLTVGDKVVLVSPVVMDASVEGKSEYFFTLGHTVGSQRRAVERFFELNSDIKTAAIICWQDGWGIAHADIFKEVMEEKNIQLLLEECTSDFSTTHLSEATKIRAARPDAVLIVSPNLDRFLARRRELKIDTKVLSTNNVVEGIETRDMPIELAQGVWFTDWKPRQEFIDAFVDAYGVFPIVEAHNSYEAIRSVARAYENNPENVYEGLKMVRYESVDGEIDFMNSENIQVNRAEAGLFVVDQGTGQYVRVD